MLACRWFRVRFSTSLRFCSERAKAVSIAFKCSRASSSPTIGVSRGSGAGCSGDCAGICGAGAEGGVSCEAGRETGRRDGRGDSCCGPGCWAVGVRGSSGGGRRGGSGEVGTGSCSVGGFNGRFGGTVPLGRGGCVTVGAGSLVRRWNQLHPVPPRSNNAHRMTATRDGCG